jgi:regulator of nonsense transcripts 3
MRPSSPPKTTPLLEALKAEKQAQKDKEAIIRNHAHYKDLTNGPPPSVLRKEEKRKAAARPSRKHAVKNIKGAAPAPAPAPAPKPPKDTPTPSVTAATAPAPAQPQVNDGAPSVVASARRGRPILGLGSRQFEAALSGVGAAGGRKRAEKSKEETPGAPDLPQENTSQEKPNPPTSPRKPRHRKGGPASTAAANPDVNSAGVLVMPGVVQIDSGGSPPTQTYGVRGGKRGGRGGRGGRGRGGPPRTG